MLSHLDEQWKKKSKNQWEKFCFFDTKGRLFPSNWLCVDKNYGFSQNYHQHLILERIALETNAGSWLDHKRVLYHKKDLMVFIVVNRWSNWIMHWSNSQWPIKRGKGILQHDTLRMQWREHFYKRLRMFSV